MWSRVEDQSHGYRIYLSFSCSESDLRPTLSEECIIGEVSTANDDLHDNFFVNPDVGRFPGVEEDEAPLLKLVSDPV